MTETPAPYGSIPQSDFESQFRRFFEAVECRTQVELAAILEVRQASVSDAKRRQSIPAGWFLRLFEKKRINPEWLRSGQGKMIAEGSPDAIGSPPATIGIITYRPVPECTTEELLAELVRRALKATG